MPRSRHLAFTAVTTEGAILPPDLLERVAREDVGLGGLSPMEYHLEKGEKLREAASRSWNRLQGLWPAFKAQREKLKPEEPGTGVTRERWLLPLFQELGYGRLLPRKAAVESEGRTFPISHAYGHAPIHLVGCNVDLDKRTAGVAGAARVSPHGLVQSFLNSAPDSLWGFVSNGLSLRILRDSSSLTHQAYVEFDLEAMMEGQLYADFVLLWLLCHQSRVESERPEDCWLEKWSQAAEREGTRFLEDLRGGVEHAIEALGKGFLAHPANNGLKDALRSGRLDKQDYYRELLRLVYRFLFLFVAEDRGLLFSPGASEQARDRYMRYYGTRRLREIAGLQRGSRHSDLYQPLRIVMERLGSDEGCPELGLPALGGFLFSREATKHINGAGIANTSLLAAVRALALTEQAGKRRFVDYRNLGPEELGSVYEALLELHPELNLDAATFELTSAAGHERKMTGSYYTPTSLIQCLLDTALDPVLEEASRTPEPERALLALKICDPACGSGHFLIAAAHRIARRLASLRCGEEEPSPETLRSALRDVIGHCVFGVDVNPMAVELCKVNLWLEALEPGKPLTFLEHRILCGNSLLGATPALLIGGGIPDEAFDPIEGDDKEYAKALRKRNRREREAGQRSFGFLAESAAYGSISSAMASLDALPDDSIASIHEKEARHRRLAESADYRRELLAADAWCAAFVWKKTKEAPPAVTQDVLLRLREEPSSLPEALRAEIARLSEQYRLFHWHLGFPDVFHLPAEGEKATNERAGWRGGFDVVLGNPPWERIKLQEKEWFAGKRPDIADAPNAATRRRLIAALADEDLALLTAFQEDRREAEGESHFVRDSGRYPLCGRGDINTYAIFAETNRQLLSPYGRAGFIIQSDIATGDTYKDFFEDLLAQGQLVSLFDFVNTEGLFPAIHRTHPHFCLMTTSGGRTTTEADFAFWNTNVGHLSDRGRHFSLSAADLALLNPNTRTCPVFRNKCDAEITKAIYRRVPVLVKEGPPEENSWGVSFQTMFHMSNDSGLFRTREQLEADGFYLEGNIFQKGDHRYLPLYEAKLIHHYDHRWATYENLETRDLTAAEKNDPEFAALPRYWVPETEVEARLSGRSARGWLLGWRDITNTTNERTVIASLLPRVGVGNNLPVMLLSTSTADLGGLLAANLSSLVLDFVSRLKVGGTHLNFFIFEQLPVLAPAMYSSKADWSASGTVADWLRPRVLELAYTAWDLTPFARDCGYEGPPFRWDEERRFLLRCELDAAFFHLYGAPREDADYILETFPIVKRKDKARHGEYRTKRVVLEIYDELRLAVETGVPYRTRLDPPAADPRAAQPPRVKAAAIAAPSPPSEPAPILPFRRLHPRREERYATCVPLLSLKAAAGSFGDEQPVEFNDWVDIRPSAPLRRGMFVAQVLGHSMEPLIPDGAWCLFRYVLPGTRQGKVVLVQHHAIHDPETGGAYTVKRYRSEKAPSEEGSWRHTAIFLEPDNPAFSPMVLRDVSGGEVRVIAEFVEVLTKFAP